MMRTMWAGTDLYICIDYFRFSPKIGEEVGMTEKDNRKLCEIIIKCVFSQIL